MTKIAIYPGTFDPVTFGHYDIIRRSYNLFDKLIVAVATDSSKKTLFTADERVEMINKEIGNIQFHENKIIVKKFDGLLVNFAKKNNSSIIIRGLRAVSDFEYEFQMFGMNYKLSPEIQTIFLPASDNTQFIASRLVKEVAKLGGKISPFVSKNVEEKLLKKIDAKN